VVPAFSNVWAQPLHNRPIVGSQCRVKGKLQDCWSHGQQVVHVPTLTAAAGCSLDECFFRIVKLKTPLSPVHDRLPETIRKHGYSHENAGD
jgi:hypothetical protein